MAQEQRDVDVPGLVEALARLLGLEKGEQRIEVHVSAGAVRRADIHLGPLRPAELRELADRVRTLASG